MPPERALSAISRPLVGGPSPRTVHELRKWIRERVDLGMRFARLGPVLQPSHWPRTYLDAEIAAWNADLGPVSFGIEPDDELGWKTVFDFGGSMLCYVRKCGALRTRTAGRGSLLEIAADNGKSQSDYPRHIPRYSGWVDCVLLCSLQVRSPYSRRSIVITGRDLSVWCRDQYSTEAVF